MLKRFRTRKLEILFNYINYSLLPQINNQEIVEVQVNDELAVYPRRKPLAKFLFYQLNIVFSVPWKAPIHDS